MATGNNTTDDSLILDGEGFEETETGYITRPGDFARPYPYESWVKKVPGLRPERLTDEYKKYVEQWSEKRQKAATISDTIRSDYLSFIKSIAIYIDDEERQKFIQDVNWNSQLDLERLIPKFSQKLRDIIRYFADKREAVIRSKLKYNMHGAFISIERMLHEYLLSNFTKRKHYEQTADKDLLSKVPDLYDVNTKLVIGVKEGYDDQNYFDKNPDFGASAYFYDVMGDSKDLYSNWETSGENDVIWLFDGGLNERKLENPIYYTVRDAVLGTSGLKGYEEDVKINKYVYDLTRKYIGNDLAFLNGGYYINDYKTYYYNFKTGNNWFYFPSGEMFYESEDIELEDVAINDTTLSSVAHGASAYEEADRIFVRFDDGTVSGAWLKKEHFETKTVSMSAQIARSEPYSFRFPFPGYGVSGDEIPWTGPWYHNFEPEYYALQEPQKRAIQKLYWESEKPDFDCKSINIQKTSLSQGRYAGSTFNTSLHLGVRDWTDTVDDAVYTGDIYPYWLFAPQVSELVVDECRNYFEYPHFKHQSTRKEPNFRDIKWCSAIEINSPDAKCAGAIAGTCPQDSDIIYKVDENGIPYEAAWLSGGEVKNIKLTNGGEDIPTSGLCYQRGFFSIFEPGEDTFFVWTGSATSADDVFRWYSNEKYSPVVANTAVLGGLPADEFDYICEATTAYPVVHSPSERTCKYICMGPDHKWVKGSFLPGQSSSDFEPRLRTGVLYRYHRASTAPKYYVAYEFSSPVQVSEWKILEKTDAGWYPTNQKSRMTIWSGDLLVYDHVENTKVAGPFGVDIEKEEATYETLKTPTGPFSIKFGLKEQRPYFAKAQNEDTKETGTKAIDVNANSVREVGNVMISNPEVVDIDINAWDLLTVYNQNSAMVWTESVEVKEPRDVLTWCNLIPKFKPNEFYPSRNDEIEASATNDKSEIVFSFVPGDRILINYWAINPFAWEQPFRNLKSGIPPTGGKYVTDEFLPGITAMYPHANMSNRHYPTMALAQDMSKFYTKEDYGGYFVPKYLGVTEAITKDPIIEIVASGRREEDPISIIASGETFAQDTGFTDGIENTGLRVKHESLEWMKTPITIGVNTGMRFDEPAIQTFVPYVTEEENRASFNKGIERADDYDEPWLRGETSKWDENGAAYDYELHRTRQEPISRWANDRFAKRSVTKVKSDIYGAQYELVKKTPDKHCIYNERSAIGTVYLREFDSKYKTLDSLNSNLNSYPPIRFGWISDFDVAYDFFYCVGKFPKKPRYYGNFRSVRQLGTFVDSVPLEPELYDMYMRFLSMIREYFSLLSDAYGIRSFAEIGKDSGTCVKTFNSIYEDAIGLLHDIEEKYVDYVEKYTPRVELRPNLNADGIRLAINSMEKVKERFEDGLAFVWEEINASTPFVEDAVMLLAFPLELGTDEDGNQAIRVNVGNIYYRLIADHPVKVSRPWFLQTKRQYLIPLVHNIGGNLVPEVVTINTKSMDTMSSTNDGLTDLSTTLTNAIAPKGSTGYSIRIDDMIDPVCAYNDDTNTLVMSQQVSGAESLVGAFGMYEYNVLDTSISGYAIIPVDKTKEFDDYEKANRRERPTEPEPQIHSNKVSITYKDDIDNRVIAVAYCQSGTIPSVFKYPVSHDCAKFDGVSWIREDTGEPFSYKSPLDRNVEVHPNWNTVPIVILFDPNNGEDTFYRVCECNSTIAEWPDNPDSGDYRVFDKWVDTETGSQVTASTRFTKSITARATFKVPSSKFNVTLSGPNGQETEEVTPGQRLTVTKDYIISHNIVNFDVYDLTGWLNQETGELIEWGPDTTQFIYTPLKDTVFIAIVAKRPIYRMATVTYRRKRGEAVIANHTYATSVLEGQMFQFQTKQPSVEFDTEELDGYWWRNADTGGDVDGDEYLEMPIGDYTFDAVNTYDDGDDEPDEMADD